jgi:hypothetical protein
MKKLAIALILLTATPATANDQGAWVKVDANGNAIGGAIVCTPDVCGDSNSPYAKATLQPGEKYVLQTKADTNGNVAGIGAQQNAEVKVNLQTNEWTIKQTEVVEVPRVSVTNTEPTIVTTGSSVGITESPTVVAQVETSTVTNKVKIFAEKTTVATINQDATTSVKEQNANLDVTVLETPPKSEIELTEWYEEWLLEWQELFKALELLFQGWVLIW